MKSQIRYIVFGSLSLFSLIGIAYLILSFTILPGFARIEERDSRQNVARVSDALKEEISKLNFTARDWAEWDDTYRFMADGNAAFRKSNLNDSSQLNLSLNASAMVRPSGQILFDQGYDLKQKRSVPLLPSFKKLIAPGAVLLQHRNIRDVHQGFVVLPEGPMLIAARPILTSANQGPIRGTLVFGRFLNEAVIHRLAEVTHLPLQIRPLNAPDLPQDFRAAKATLNQQRPVWINAKNRSTIAGYSILYDVFGNPGLIVRVETPRVIYAQGMASVINFLCWLSAISLVLGGGIFFLFRKLTLAYQTIHEKRLVEQTNRELQKALDDLNASYWHLKKIQEVLPICMNCGKVKSGDADWENVVDYLKRNSLFLSHGFCPDCFEVLRAQFIEETTAKEG
jgi:hypothetical protein